MELFAMTYTKFETVATGDVHLANGVKHGPVCHFVASAAKSTARAKAAGWPLTVTKRCVLP